MTHCSVLDKNASPQKRVWYMAFDPNLFLIHDWSFFWLPAGEGKKKRKKGAAEETTITTTKITHTRTHN